MAYDKPFIQTSNPYKNVVKTDEINNIYYGEVISIDDSTDGGMIRVKIPELDNRISNENLSPCYPLLPKFFHVYPQVGEMVRVFIENIKYPQRSRYWLGSVISQLQKVGYDSIYTALSTTNVAITNPETAVTTYPDAEGVFPLKSDIAIIGKVNTDVILRTNEVHIRAGKHEPDDILKLNVKNPAEITLAFEQENNTGAYHSNAIMMADKIGLISHSGNPQFKAARLTPDDRQRIFDEGHPIARGDVLVEALNIIRSALINHIHGYSNLPSDKTSIIKDLENIDFSAILQKNIVVN